MCVDTRILCVQSIHPSWGRGLGRGQNNPWAGVAIGIFPRSPSLHPQGNFLYTALRLS